MAPDSVSTLNLSTAVDWLHSLIGPSGLLLESSTYVKSQF